MLYRYISHFRSVHRGAYFAQLRTTTVRKLLPESWGFLCPVHTPDGSPCGLLTHMTSACRVVAAPAADPDGTATAIVHVSCPPSCTSPVPVIHVGMPSTVPYTFRLGRLSVCKSCIAARTSGCVASAWHADAGRIIVFVSVRELRQ